MLQTFSAPKQVSVDSLLDVLVDPNKVKKLLQDIKKKEDALAKKLSAYNKASSVEAYCKKQQALAEEAKKEAEASIASIFEESKKEQSVLAKQKAQIKKDLSSLNTKVKKLTADEKELQDKVNAYEKLKETLDAKEVSVVQREQYAESLVLEYNAKLNDIKERLRGL
jgi:chromosome segregation ATPase